MNKTTRNNYIAFLLVILFVFLGLALGGCAGKGLKVDYTDPEGKQVTINTDYQVEQGFIMERDGDGYRIELGSATTKDGDMSIMVEMLRMMQSMMIMQGVASAPPNEEE